MRPAMTLAATSLLCLSVAACGSNQLDSLVAPTVTVTVTETFTGTITRNGATSHSFPVSSTGGGSVTATVRTLSPDSASIIGISLGTWNGTACAAIISNDRATQSVTILGQATGTGSLCVRLFDPGTITDPQNYELEVVHP